ncbi:hypothetical protein G7Y89_g7524 [Cudoniella acicularis]|uniref:SH3 domain-containing protein n=1 Tax=Cudoniella acicularis TaxID=354080 RepID=A0A8H4W1Z5_9HELO|nr:hypothetical protein G7Y89_g7524 [Cudoniella acicularis]
MASRPSNEPPARPEQPRPEPGQILIVIHDFAARSSDELSLSKGDRVELIERDDDFGDVYTRIAPRGPPSYPPTSTIQRPPPSTVEPPKEQPVQAAQSPAIPITESPAVNETRMSAPAPTQDKDKTPQASRHVSASGILDLPTITSPLIPSSPAIESEKTVPSTTKTASIPIQPKSVTTAAKTMRMVKIAQS